MVSNYRSCSVRDEYIIGEKKNETKERNGENGVHRYSFLTLQLLRLKFTSLPFDLAKVKV